MATNGDSLLHEMLCERGYVVYVRRSESTLSIRQVASLLRRCEAVVQVFSADGIRRELNADEIEWVRSGYPEFLDKLPSDARLWQFDAIECLLASKFNRPLLEFCIEEDRRLVESQLLKVSLAILDVSSRYQSKVELTSLGDGTYTAVASLRPWLQLEELQSEMKMVTGLPKPADKSVSSPSRPSHHAAEPTLSNKVSVFSEKCVQPGETYLVQIYIHTALSESVVDEDATCRDPQTVPRGRQTLSRCLTPGMEVTIHLAATDVQLDQAIETQVWREPYICSAFALPVPEEYSASKVICKATILADSVPLGHVQFILQMDHSTKQVGEVEKIDLKETIYRKAFISHASEDRSEVLKRVQMLRLQNIEFFQDLLSLQPGEQWWHTLCNRIEECELFLLFWSDAAKKSVWVEKEWRHALKCKVNDALGRPEIVPVILTSPPAEPPAELNSLHFNDYLPYLSRVLEMDKSTIAE